MMRYAFFEGLRVIKFKLLKQHVAFITVGLRGSATVPVHEAATERSHFLLGSCINTTTLQRSRFPLFISEVIQVKLY